jgi:hypothetical protein
VSYVIEGLQEAGRELLRIVLFPWRLAKLCRKMWRNARAASNGSAAGGQS